MPRTIDPYIYDESVMAAVDEYFENLLHSGSENEEDEEEDEDEDDEEEEDDDEEEVEAIEYIQIEDNTPRVSSPSEEERTKRRRVENGGDTCEGDEKRESSQNSQWNRTDIDGLFCPICMEAWTNEGDHHICCLPCGHLFGLSCITKWFKQCKSKAKCPQCNRKSTLKDIRKLFAPRIAVVDEESQKRIRSLEDKCNSFQKRDAVLSKKESEWKRREAELEHKIHWLTKRTTELEKLVSKFQSRPSGLVTAGSNSHEDSASGNLVDSMFGSQDTSSCFVFQGELRVDGARLFDIDTSSQIILLTRSLRGMAGAGSHVLTKMSLLPPHDSEDIPLPPVTKFIKDLHISPHSNSLALFASLGKKLCALSTESNNLILSYDLPAPAWSCSWDLNSSHFVYAGLQTGMLLVFDLRQTGRPLESRRGLSTNPIHTIHTVIHDSPSPSVSTVLSASSIGICNWNFGGVDERPFVVPETENQGVCVSFAFCPIKDNIVASYRPRVESSADAAVSQPVLSPFPTIGQGTMGSHLYLKRVGTSYRKLGIACATVNSIRLPKSTIIDLQNQKSVFAAGDEVRNGLTLQELPSFTVAQRFRPHKQHICDIKYASRFDGGILGCLSEDMLQLFTNKPS